MIVRCMGGIKCNHAPGTCTATRISEQLQDFINANQFSSVVVGHVIPGGVIYTLADNRMYKLSNAECKLLPSDYPKWFHPEVSDPTPYALGLLTEESGEILQNIGKWQRFGPDHVNKHGKTAPGELSLEVGDMLAAIDYALMAGVLNAADVRLQHSLKLNRLLDPESKDDQGKRLAPEVTGKGYHND